MCLATCAFDFLPAMSNVALEQTGLLRVEALLSHSRNAWRIPSTGSCKLKSVEARRKFVQTCRCKGAICEVDGFTHFGAANFSPVK